MKTRDKIIIASVSVSVVVTVAITLGVVLSKKDSPADDAPPPQGDRCPANTVCVSDVCKQNPLEGKWRLVGGENRDVQVFDGDQEFEFEYNSTNASSGADQYSSTARAWGSTPLIVLTYRDVIDEVTGDRVISIFASVRPYSVDYESYEPGDSARHTYVSLAGGPLDVGAGMSGHFPLAVIPPTSPDFQACVEVDAIDFNALCANSTSPVTCMGTVPLYLERVQ
jgi:hypothetical protein